MDLPKEILGEILTFDLSNVNLLDLTTTDIVEILGRYGDPHQLLADKIYEMMLRKRYSRLAESLFDIIGSNFSVDVYSDQFWIRARDIYKTRDDYLIKDVLVREVGGEHYDLEESQRGNTDIVIYLPGEHARIVAMMLLEYQSHAST